MKSSAKKNRIFAWSAYAASVLLAAAIFIALAISLLLYRQGTRPLTGSAQYVAFGSSFASGPGLFPLAADSPFLCARSDQNYAHQLARKRGLALLDMSCAGATTQDVLLRRQYAQPEQIAALSASTELVTATIGGNDVEYLSNLIALSCRPGRSIVNTITRACVVTPQSTVDKHFDALGNGLLAIAHEIKSRSPHAKLVFVDYLDVLPATGNCPALGLSDNDVARMRDVADRLKQVTRTVAIAAGAVMVDANVAGVDHSACSDDPWINVRFPKQLLVAPFHPNIAGMTAMAAAVDKAL